MMDNRTYLRGDMYYANLGDGTGSEQTGCRPVVIIQNNVGNAHSSTVIVAAITGKAGTKARLPTHCRLNAENGLHQPSVVLLEQLRTIDKDRLENYIGRLNPPDVDRLNHALSISVGLKDALPNKLILCLCTACANNFYDTGSYFMHRVNMGAAGKETCTYCSTRQGYDYELTPRGNKEAKKDGLSGGQSHG